MIKKMFAKKKAFTLVEMLIVVVIIGILASALIPRLTGDNASRAMKAEQYGAEIGQTWKRMLTVDLSSTSLTPSDIKEGVIKWMLGENNTFNEGDYEDGSKIKKIARHTSKASEFNVDELYNKLGTTEDRTNGFAQAIEKVYSKFTTVFYYIPGGTLSTKYVDSQRGGLLSCFLHNSPKYGYFKADSAEKYLTCTIVSFDGRATANRDDVIEALNGDKNKPSVITDGVANINGVSGMDPVYGSN